jgi:hypothetical protein
MVRVRPKKGRGTGEIVPLESKMVGWTRSFRRKRSSGVTCRTVLTVQGSRSGQADILVHLPAGHLCVVE